MSFIVIYICMSLHGDTNSVYSVYIVMLPRCKGDTNSVYSVYVVMLPHCKHI